MVKKSGILVVSGLLFLLFAATALFAAPADTQATGQTQCYNAAGTVIDCATQGQTQDGAMQTGVAWPNPRFTVSSSGTGSVVTDNLTGLIWAQDGGTPTVDICTGGTKTWQAALDYVDCLNTNNYLGHSDWRLPNINELKSLIHTGLSNTSAWLNSQGLSNIQAYPYWSSSTCAHDTAFAWLVDMFEDIVFPGYKALYNLYIWPVRGGQCGSLGSSAICLSKTGQTLSYSSGDDGVTQTGVVSPVPRFTREDGTALVTGNTGSVVVDQLTGLMWNRNGNVPGTPKTWQEALDYVASLNSSVYLGYNDWRLPNRCELSTLVDYGQSSPAVWLNTQGFSNVQAAYYWPSSSSTTADSYYIANAWYVNLSWSHVAADSKSYSYYVWPVRGGQSGSFTYLTVTKSGAGAGTVTVDRGAFIWSGSTGTASYGTAMSANLAAQPASGSMFTGWSGDADCSDGSVTMSGHRNCVAMFTRVRTVAATAGPHGNLVTSYRTSPQLVSYGSSTSFKFKAYSGYHVASITSTCGAAAYTNGLNTVADYIYTTDAVTSDCSVTAAFAPNTVPGSPAVAGITPTNNTTPTWTWTTGGGGNGMYKYQLDNSGWVATTATAYTPASPLAPGSHSFYVQERDSAGNWSFSGVSTIEIDVASPTLSLSTLPDGAVTKNWVLNITGTAVDPSGVDDVTMAINSALTTTLSESFNRAELLQPGVNTLIITATDNAGNETTETRTITYDATAPVLTITAPADNSTTAGNIMDVTGRINTNATVKVKVNNGPYEAALVTGQTFSATVTLEPGTNTLEFIATSASNKTSSAKRTVVYDSQGATLSVTLPGEDSVVMKKSAVITGSVADTLEGATIAMEAGGQAYTPTVTNNAFSQTVNFATDDTYPIFVTVKDSGGAAISTVQRNIIHYTIVSPSSLLFRKQVKNTTSAVQTITVSNTGEAPLTLTGFSITGTHQTQFTETNDCPATLAPGASCAISVTFTPTTAGAMNATLIVNVASPGASQAIPLRGTGTNALPVLTVSPTSLSFGGVANNTVSLPQNVIVKNTGTAPLIITGIGKGGTNQGQFSQTSACPIGGTGLAPGTSCVVKVKFKPTTVGAKSASILINADAPAASKAVTLSGTGM